LAHWARSNPLSGQLVTFFRPAKVRKHLTVQKRPARSAQSRRQAKREKEPAAGRVAVPEGELDDPGRGLLPNPDACEEGFRDTKSPHYGLYLACESRIQAERRANLLLIAESHVNMFRLNCRRFC
jgi:hypothetical protein